MVPIEHSVRDLRRRWKPIKDGPAAADEHEAIRVRLHRCWSWLQAVEDLPADIPGLDDARLIYGWIALNSLYGRWDPALREPVADKPALDAFLRRVFQFDRERLLAAMLTAERELVKAIVGDEYLSRYYWRDPGEEEARRAQTAARKLGSMYVEGRFESITDAALQRVYLARCQLVHGAATYSGRLNRTAVERCAAFLSLFLRTASQVIIDHAWSEQWDDLCYPPIDSSSKFSKDR